MARIRSIKPEIITDVKTGTLSDLCFRFFVSMLPHCDDYGVISYNHKELKARTLPYLDGEAVAVIEPLIQELIANELVTVFTFQERSWNAPKKYLYINNFHKHQRVDKPGTPLLEQWGWLKGDTLQCFIEKVHENQLVILNLEAAREIFGEHSKNVPAGKERKGKDRIGEEGIGKNIVETQASRPRTNKNDTLAVFEFWQKTMGHSSAKLDEKRKAQIGKALRMGYSVAQLCDAILGCSYTPHNMGDNDRGQRYDGLHVILRDADQIDRFIRNCENPPKVLRKTDKLLEGNITALNQWMEKKKSKLEDDNHAATRPEAVL